MDVEARRVRLTGKDRHLLALLLMQAIRENSPAERGDPTMRRMRDLLELLTI